MVRFPCPKVPGFGVHGFRGSRFRVIAGCQVSGNKEPQNTEQGITNVEGKKPHYSKFPVRYSIFKIVLPEAGIL
jgi:hypothetical protein